MVEKLSSALTLAHALVLGLRPQTISRIWLPRQPSCIFLGQSPVFCSLFIGTCSLPVGRYVAWNPDEPTDIGVPLHFLCACAFTNRKRKEKEKRLGKERNGRFSRRQELTSASS